MSILKVARLGHPVLRSKAKPIDPKDIKSAPVQKLIDDMIETMAEYHGIGLAGPQVHEGLRLFIAGIEKKDRRTGEIEILSTAIVNPEVTAIGRDLVASASAASIATARRSTSSSKTSPHASSSTRTTI